MEIKIDTNDILGDETTIRNEVIAEVSNALKQDLRIAANDELTKLLNEALTEIVKQKVTELLDVHLDTEFTETDRWGDHGKTTTVRSRIANILSQQCEFKNGRYSSDRNAFTEMVLKVVAEELGRYKKEFTSQINQRLVKECLDDATAKLKAACGIQ